MLFTSGWFASPTTIIAYPSRLNDRACSCALLTKGQVASMIRTPFATSDSWSGRGMRPRAVLVVPPEHVPIDLLVRLPSPLPPLAVAPEGTDRRVGVEEELRVGVRKDDRPCVAPLENDPASFPHLPLEGHHGLPHREVDGNLRRPHADPRGADRGGHVLARQGDPILPHFLPEPDPKLRA